jgi:hypothetical protein
VFAARVVMLILTVVALLVATRLSSLLEIYKYLAVVFGGIGTIMIARWYWWRVTAVAEIAAIAASLIIGNVLQMWLPSEWFAVRLVSTIVSVTVIWVVVTYLTSRKEPTLHTLNFYRKMRIAGPGWQRVQKITNIHPEKGSLGRNVKGWLCCICFVYAFMFAIGKCLLLQFYQAVCYFSVAAILGYNLRRLIRRIQFE